MHTCGVCIVRCECRRWSLLDNDYCLLLGRGWRSVVHTYTNVRVVMVVNMPVMVVT